MWGFMAKRKAISTRVRFEVLKRDSFKCQYCGANSSNGELHIDHITPLALGGKNDILNLVTSCAKCNLGKSSIPLTSIPAGLELLAKDAMALPIAKFQQAMESKAQREYEQALEVINLLYPQGWDFVEPKTSRFIDSAIFNIGFEAVKEAAACSARGHVANPLAYFKAYIKNIYKEISA